MVLPWFSRAVLGFIVGHENSKTQNDFYLPGLWIPNPAMGWAMS